MTDTDSIGAELMALIDEAIIKHVQGDNPIFKMLAQSDAVLKSYVPYFCAAHTRPTTPPTTTGSAEFGIFPYWAKMLPIWEAQEAEHPIVALIPKQVRQLIVTMQAKNLIPPPTITDQDYSDLVSAIEQGTAIGPDGTIFGLHGF